MWSIARWATAAAVVALVAKQFFLRSAGPLVSALGVPEEGANAFAGCAPRDPPAMLLLRTPKAGSTFLSNILGELQSANGLKIFELEEFPLAIGAIPASTTTTTTLQSMHPEGSGRWLQRLTDGLQNEARHKEATFFSRRQRSVFEGHVFLHSDGGESRWPTGRAVTPNNASILSLAREPIERLASGYAYTREKPMPAEIRARTLERLGNKTLGECAMDPACSRKNELGRLCSFHTLYLCGHHSSCALDNEDDILKDGVATDAAVARAIANLRDDRSVLLALPLESLDNDGLAMLETLLPGYFAGASQAASKLKSREISTSSYDSRFTRRSPRPGSAKATAQSAQGEQGLALQRICRQDIIVYAEILKLFKQKRTACRARSEEAAGS